jgi:hypothetical protein
LSAKPDRFLFFRAQPALTSRAFRGAARERRIFEGRFNASFLTASAAASTLNRRASPRAILFVTFADSSGKFLILQFGKILEYSKRIALYFLQSA